MKRNRDVDNDIDNKNMENFIYSADTSLEMLKPVGGGKATNLAKMSQAGLPVPPWYCVAANGFEFFKTHHNLNFDFSKWPNSTNLKEVSATIEKQIMEHSLPPALTQQLEHIHTEMGFQEVYVAVRSSGLDEDSSDHSFAGQFSSFLYQKNLAEIQEAIKGCWASGFSERALSYRIEKGLKMDNIRVGVVVQKMLHATSAGVAFSRHPIRVLDRETLLISSVWGLGEGLVSGELDSDNFEVKRELHRPSLLDSGNLLFSEKIKRQIAEKEFFVVPQFYGSQYLPEGETGQTSPTSRSQMSQSGVVKLPLPVDKKNRPSLSDIQIKEVAELVLKLEEITKSPQDCEWVYEDEKLWLVQTRPITNIPSDAYFRLRGERVFLWDNSNIIESYSGVTSPLTFSFASRAYRQVYIQFCQTVGISDQVINQHESMFRNMLGLLRGRIYYNLINWYRLVLLLPGSSTNKGFMETMMGVKQKLKPELANLFDFTKNPPQYSLFAKGRLALMTLWRFLKIDSIVATFMEEFTFVYSKARKTDFTKMTLSDQMQQFWELENQVLRKWQAPIINDYLCMIFFGLLKRLTEKWLSSQGDLSQKDPSQSDISLSGSNLQNDLLCGQGDLESTEPTKMLMRMAAHIDQNDPHMREFFLTHTNAQIVAGLRSQFQAHVTAKTLTEFLDKYGFRCVDELKLEQPDLHDNPEFAINSVVSYLKTKSYSISVMEEREKSIRQAAETQVRQILRGYRGWIYFWVVKQTRKAVRNRENLRFARTKIFGIARHLFRAVGDNLHALGLLHQPRDVFYLTVEELIAFDEGLAISLDIKEIAERRKLEFQKYENETPPPERLMTIGSVGASSLFSQILIESDLLAQEAPLSNDPNILIGTPCCPGVVEGVCRVVKDLKDAEGINGEILVTSRTDPGWVPLYPSCSGLLIERGSLLSHSAVVARELGLPTIVGISGGLMTKLKTGQKVRIDAAKGEVRIL